MEARKPATGEQSEGEGSRLVEGSGRGERLIHGSEGKTKGKKKKLCPLMGRQSPTSHPTSTAAGLPSVLLGLRGPCLGGWHRGPRAAGQAAIRKRTEMKAKCHRAAPMKPENSAIGGFIPRGCQERTGSQKSHSFIFSHTLVIRLSRALFSSEGAK